MKILKIISAVIAALILLFLSLGMFSPSIHYINSVLVSSTPEKCWAAIQDTSRMGQWMEGFESFKRIQGDSLTPGTVYELVLVQDKRMVMTEKVMEVNKPSRIAFQLTNEVLQSDYRFEFTSEKDQTVITASYKITGNNLLWKSVFVLSRSYFEGQGNKQLEALKKVVESN